MTKSHPFRRLLASVMPGIFLIGYNIGTGSLTAMSKAGANFGADLLWAVLVSGLITWYLINFFSRFTMASGLTAMEAFRRHLHPEGEEVQDVVEGAHPKLERGPPRVFLALEASPLRNPGRLQDPDLLQDVRLNVQQLHQPLSGW